MAEQVAGLLAVFGLLAIAVWALGKKTGRFWLFPGRRASERGTMFVAGRLALTAQHSLHLIRIGDRTVLLATHPQGATFDPAGAQFLAELGTAIMRQRGEES
jgi:flagellar biogenesis protein FliO